MATSSQVNQAISQRARLLSRQRTKIIYYDRQILNGLNQTIDQRLSVVGNLLRDRMKLNISIPVLTAAGPRGGRVVIERSQPGEFPRMDLGELRDSVFFDRPSPTSCRVGTDLWYGLLLEIGTTRMRPRPWLVRTLLEDRQYIVNILTRPISSLPGVPQPAPTFSSGHGGIIP